MRCILSCGFNNIIFIGSAVPYCFSAANNRVSENDLNLSVILLLCTPKWPAEFRMPYVSCHDIQIGIFCMVQIVYRT